MNKKLPKLLNSGNAKTRKGEKLGWKTHGLHLAPYNLSGYQVCQHARRWLRFCLPNLSGLGVTRTSQESRIAKTKRFFEDKNLFVWTLAREIGNAVKLAAKKGEKPCFRLNLTSDLPWESIRVESNGKKLSLLEMFPDVQFYDYTKSFKRVKDWTEGKMPSNYHLTFSRSECNEAQCDILAKLGANIAVVWRVAKDLQRNWSCQWRRHRLALSWRQK